MLVKRQRKDISGNYNFISINKFSLKFEIGKESWYFNNPFLCKSVFP